MDDNGSSHTWLQRLERGYAWSMLGAIVGIVGVILAIFALRERRAELQFQLISESNVLDVHTPVAALDVLYQGESLQKRQLNLRVITLRVANTGDADILQSQYDQRLPCGLAITRGRIVEIRLLSTNSSYLRNSLSPRL